MEEKGIGKILIVDDEQDLQEGVEIILSQQGFIVSSFTSGVKLLQFLKQDSNFFLLCTDWCMPEMNGAEVISAVREILPNIIVFVTTATEVVINQQEIFKKQYRIHEIIKKDHGYYNFLRPLILKYASAGILK